MRGISIYKISIGDSADTALEKLKKIKGKVERAENYVYITECTLWGYPIDVTYSLSEGVIHSITVSYKCAVRKGRGEIFSVFREWDKILEKLFGCSYINEMGYYWGTKRYFSPYDKISICCQRYGGERTINHLFLYISELKEEDVKQENDENNIMERILKEGKDIELSTYRKKKYKFDWFKALKIIMSIIALVIAFLYVQGERYYIGSNGLVVDKWLNKAFPVSEWVKR